MRFLKLTKIVLLILICLNGNCCIIQANEEKNMDKFVKLDVKKIDKIEIQKIRANFPLFMPKNLNKNFMLVDALFRPENISKNYPRSSLKLLITSIDKQKILSIKEFNYDWAPPAYDCPSLWHNHREFSNVEPTNPTPYLLENNVLWIGKNYKNQRAASIIKDRTTIELSTIKGAFTDYEIIDIVKSLVPISNQQRNSLLKNSYTENSLNSGKPTRSVNVPISFWSFPVADSKLKFQTAYTPESIKKNFDIKHIKIPVFLDYKLDSIFVQHHSEKPDKYSRYTFIYESIKSPGTTISIVQVNKNSPAAPTIPAIPDLTQKFSYESINIEDIKCYYAYRSENYGPHELLFQHGEYTYLILIKPSSWTTRKWFLNFVNEYLKLYKTNI